MIRSLCKEKILLPSSYSISNKKYRPWKMIKLQKNGYAERNNDIAKGVCGLYQIG